MPALLGAAKSGDAEARKVAYRAYTSLADGSVCHLALRLLILTAARSAEVRFARFEEIEGSIWVIPARRTKGGQEHRIPLSREVLSILDQAKPLSGEGFLFPSVGKGVTSDATMCTDDGAARDGGTPTRRSLIISRLVRRGD